MFLSASTSARTWLALSFPVGWTAVEVAFGPEALTPYPVDVSRDYHGLGPGIERLLIPRQSAVAVGQLPRCGLDPCVVRVRGTTRFGQ